MPFVPDVAYIDTALDNLLGSGVAFEFGLLTGDPRIGGVEITGPGYARIAGVDDATFWQPSSGGQKVSLPQTFPASTDAWDTATHEGRWIGGVLVDFEELSEPIIVTAAGPGPTVSAVRAFNAEL